MAPATGYVHRAVSLHHPGNVNFGKRSPPDGRGTNVTGFAAAIAILGAIIIGRSPLTSLQV
jgi:hypothetical protein